MIDGERNPLLCDFGMSRINDENPLWLTSATHTGGTIRYSAPELLLGTQPTVTMESDIYSFGITSYVRRLSPGYYERL